MNKKTKNFIRAAVVTALLAWPGVETFRLVVAKKQLNASLEQQNSVLLRLAQARSVKVAGKPAQP